MCLHALWPALLSTATRGPQSERQSSRQISAGSRWHHELGVFGLETRYSPSPVARCSLPVAQWCDGAVHPMAGGMTMAGIGAPTCSLDSTSCVFSHMKVMKLSKGMPTPSYSRGYGAKGFRRPMNHGVDGAERGVLPGSERGRTKNRTQGQLD